MRSISLRTWIGLLLGSVVLLTFLIVGCVLLIYRLPQIEANLRSHMQIRAESVANLLDYYTAGIEAQLRPLAGFSREHPKNELHEYLEALVHNDGDFEAVFMITADGRVQGVGLPDKSRAAGRTLYGADFSQNPFFRELKDSAEGREGKVHALWSDRYLSILTGKHAVGVAMSTGGRIIIGELSLDRVLDMLSQSVDDSDSVISIIDRRGQWLSSSRHDAPGMYFNYAVLPSFLAIVSGKPLPQYEDFLGQRLLIGGVLSSRLNWVISSAAPAGWDIVEYRMTVGLVLAGFVGALLLSFALAPAGANYVVKLVQPLINHSHRIAGGDYPQEWPRPGMIRELNRLSGDLRRMVNAMRSREAALRQNEQKLETIFHASPAAMLVADARQGFRVLDVNAAWSHEMRRARADVLGLDSDMLGVWADEADRDRFSAILGAGGVVEDMEAWLMRGDGQRALARISARIAQIGDERLLLVTLVDITEQRRIEQQILQLNAELEERVAERTEALSMSNDELEATVENLKLTQKQLVQSEKIASLGSLVAGVAHELSTPVGNALMATSTLADCLRNFSARKDAGMRRSDLESFLEVVGSACDISERNLHRASELVGSFKQVAVDQSSDQRRRFELAEVVREIILTLQPTLKRTPYRLETDIPAGLMLDSYPGALGQVLTNLINNAILHGFAGRDHGCVRISASADDEGFVELRVGDDGCGIRPEDQPRIFDPFFTTRLGSGGSGLGLHISHNAVTRVLGGVISLVSGTGEGALFSILLPQVAPRPEKVAPA